VPGPNALVDSDFLADLDEIRGISGELGLRVYSATVHVTTWSGSRVGQGTKAVKTLPFTNTAPTTGDPAPPIMIRQVSRKEAIASGGLYTNRDLKAGPITPYFAATLAQAGGGYSDPMIDPEATVTPTEVTWNVLGPSLPAAGATFEKIGEEASSMHYFVYLRQSGRSGP
jgi:hypothetical protein